MQGCIGCREFFYWAKKNIAGKILSNTYYYGKGYLMETNKGSIVPQNETHARLLDIAKTKCLPYLVSQENFIPYLDQITFVLVGSVATGLCREGSDIDIALICDRDILDKISSNTSWAAGRPTETIIQGTQLHYYAVSFERISEKLQELDDGYLYLYSNAIILRDAQENYLKRLSKLFENNPEIRKQRIEGKVDILLRRLVALSACIQEGDPIVTSKVAIEVISLCLKIIAILDNVPFDPRKRFFKTALAGNLGKRLACDIRGALCELGSLGKLDAGNDCSIFELLGKLQSIAEILCDSARKQGFSPSLKEADRRHLEN